MTYGGSVVLNEKIYLFGGNYFDDNLDDYIYSNRLYVFDPLDESWVRLDMPVAVNTNGVIVDGILYTFGGYNGSVLSDIKEILVQIRVKHFTNAFSIICILLLLMDL